MRDSATAIAALRRRISQVEGLRQTETSGVVPLGHAGIDARLGGGLERGRLHEIFAETEDASSAGGFASMIVRRAERPQAPVVWLRQDEAQRAGGVLHMPGLVELGIGRVDLVIGVLPDPLSLLRVAADVARCAEVGVMVIELWNNPRPLDLTGTRRLAVATEASGVTALLLRVGAEQGPSAAATRWSIRALPALPLEANAPGFAALDIELVRQRGGRTGGRWSVEWDRDQAIFREQGQLAAGLPPDAPLPGLVVPALAGGTARA
ncbi:ImuA family protein [Sphingomonas sp. PB4P5]|uniref:ImuA family protein n=1 Tax=Parasphingomonas puruogangriensis TaxID=3096155 RepID=UPI002FC61B03